MGGLGLGRVEGVHDLILWACLCTVRLGFAGPATLVCKLRGNKMFWGTCCARSSSPSPCSARSRSSCGCTGPPTACSFIAVFAACFSKKFLMLVIEFSPCFCFLFLVFTGLSEGDGGFSLSTVVVVVSPASVVVVVVFVSSLFVVLLISGFVLFTIKFLHIVGMVG